MVGLLLLHGQPGSPEDWEAVVGALGEGLTPIVPTRPGWDGRTRPTGLEGNAAAALRALDLAGVQRAAVVGHSLGGAVAAWLAATRPERAAALVLVAPSANRQALVPLDHLLATPALGDALGAASLVLAGNLLALGATRRLLARELRISPEYLRRTSPLLCNPRTWRAFSTEQRMLIRELPSLEARLAAIRAPTTVVAGTADRVVPIRAARALVGQIPDAHLVAMPGGHHLLHQQRPAELAQIIRSALAGAESSGEG